MIDEYMHEIKSNEAIVPNAKQCNPFIRHDHRMHTNSIYLNQVIA